MDQRVVTPGADIRLGPSQAAGTHPEGLPAGPALPGANW